MNRRAAAITLAVVCGLALGALAWWRFAGRAAHDLGPAPAPSASTAPAGAANGATPPTPPAPGAELPAWNVRLYFPGTDGLLYPEARELHAAEEPQQRLRAVMAALLAGPQDPALQPPLPHGVEVETAFLAADGVAYLALHSADHAAPPSAGSQYEMTAIYSLIDTVALNLDGAKRVVLLWNGSQLESFGGHLDTSRPLAPDTSLLARAPGASTAPPATGDAVPAAPASPPSGDTPRNTP